jgi:hypothetical protein
VPAWPEGASVLRELARLWRARLTLAVIDGIAQGCALAGVVALVAWIAGVDVTAGWMALVVLGTAVVTIAVAASRRTALPREVERRAPSCDNLVVTATELLNDPARVDPGIGALVCRHAAQRLTALDSRSVFPIARPIGRSLVAIGVAAAIIVATHAWPLHRGGSTAVTASTAAAIAHVTVTIHPPAYTAEPDRTVQDPTDIEALTGSVLHVVATTTASAATLETVDGRQPLVSSANGLSADVTLARDGFLALQADQGPRRLIGLIADVDHPPLIHVTKPGRDLFVPDGNRRLAIEIDAEDDLGLATLRLAYTKVSGSGEDFTFGEGEVPVTLTKVDDRHWHAVADWNLASLKLAPSDMVVYRGSASDRRPGATAVDSDAFIVQVMTPNQAALGGFSIDDDPNKYALSQRMVILKTERLLAKKSSLAAADYLDEAMGIAAEERQVRAMFVFMLGGEFEDANVGDALNEVAEAESEGDIAAGHLRNQARVDLGLATRYMSTASSSLGVPDVDSALKSEKSALDAIQRAFTKDRYLLRALSSIERIDLTRRLGGTLTNLAHGPRPAATPEAPEATETLRKLLARVAAAASLSSRDRAAALTTLAEDCVRADPTSAPLREVATALGQAATEATSSATEHPALDKAATALAAIIRTSSPDASPATSSDLRRLNGALTDAAKTGRPGGVR